MGGDAAGTVAIVTGGNRGVGRVIARRFLEEGASVVTCSRAAYEEPPAAEGVAGAEGRVVHEPCDVRDVHQIDSVVTRALDTFGRVDVLVNNAGGSPVADAGSASPRFHKAIIEINLTGPLWFAQRVNAVMQEQDDGGSIVNISSMASVVPSPGLASYGAAKAGLNHLTRTLAVEFGPKVRVNCIALGTIQTEALDEHIFGNDPERKRRYAEGVPLRRIGTPEEIADTCNLPGVGPGALRERRHHLGRRRRGSAGMRRATAAQVPCAAIWWGKACRGPSGPARRAGSGKA